MNVGGLSHCPGGSQLLERHRLQLCFRAFEEGGVLKVYIGKVLKAPASKFINQSDQPYGVSVF